MKRDKLQNYKQTWKYIKPCRKYLLGYLLISITDAAAGILFPLYGAKILLNMTTGKVEELFYTALIVLLLNCFTNITSFFKSSFYQKIHMRTLISLQKELAKETLKLEIKEIDNASTGLFVDRLCKDASEISSVWMETTYWTSNIISKIGIIIAIFILNKYIFVYTIISAIILFILNQLKLKKLTIIRKENKKLEEQKTSLISELIRGIRDIKVLNARSTALNKTEEVIKNCSNKQLEYDNNRRKYTVVIDLFKSFTSFIFIILGILLYKNKLLMIPEFVIAYNYRYQMQNLLTSFSNLLDYNKKFQIATDRVYEVINNKKFKKEKFGTLSLTKLNGNIVFDNVTFGYNEKQDILKNVSFEIKPNQQVAFVGKSGAGKTTIFNLITKLYKCDDGKILLDNNDINDLTCNSIRDNMSVINQAPYFFNFSIKENMLISKSNATISEIRKACKLACIDDFIMSLPEKYDTLLGENGVILSGGQKQRLAIARALLTKTEIILFDEATSALDNETQSKIQEAIKNLKGEYTVLIIAHRLSTIIESDNIFVLNDGKIVDSGTHEELMKKCKFYNNLYKKDLFNNNKGA